MSSESNIERIESLWGGEFGDEYVERNLGAYDARAGFWESTLPRVEPTRVLEVGCNVGGNLRFIAPRLPVGAVYGMDINLKAIEMLRRQLPQVNALVGPIRRLPFRDGWFDFVFSMGVLIHQPEESIGDVIAEMLRVSSMWVLTGEYFAERSEEVPYRGVPGALFRRDYGRMFREAEPSLSLVDTGRLTREDGFDDVTWWLFGKGA